MLSSVQADAQVNVTQEHNNSLRDGVYIDAGFTPSAAANLTRDLTFDGTISGTRAHRTMIEEQTRKTPMRHIDPVNHGYDGPAPRAIFRHSFVLKISLDKKD